MKQASSPKAGTALTPDALEQRIEALNKKLSTNGLPVSVESGEPGRYIVTFPGRSTAVDSEADPKDWVVLLLEAAASTDDGGLHHLELRRNASGKFSVRAKKLGPADGRGRRKSLDSRGVRGLTRPLAVRGAIQKLATGFVSELPWAQIVRQIATLDWITGAVIAAHAGCDIPPLPEEEALLEQSSSRSLGLVRVGVEWGYALQEIRVPFSDWVAILNGQWWSESEPYWYEGQEFIATWSFNGRGRLEVSYGDDGASGWEGRLSAADVIEGPQIDGVDLARLALKATQN